MKTLIATFAVLGALSTLALAGDALADDHADEAENACAAEESTEEAAEEAAEDEAENACAAEESTEEAAEDEAENACAAEAPKEEKKGKGMKKSNDGNMISYDEDE